MAEATRLLLVEDSKFLRIANARALTKAGYFVICAGDGDEALKLASEERPDLILLDMMIPKLSGPNVMKALKDAPATRAIPIIVLSSLPQANAEKLVAAGAAAYFEKSSLEFDRTADKLTIAVEKVLNEIKHQKETDSRLRDLAAKKAAGAGR